MEFLFYAVVSALLVAIGCAFLTLTGFAMHILQTIQKLEKPESMDAMSPLEQASICIILAMGHQTMRVFHIALVGFLFCALLTLALGLKLADHLFL